MPAHRLIDVYLQELRAELKLPRRTRERVQAEVADHLHAAAERRRGDGGGEVQQHAIDAFGSPRLVAGRFSEELALVGARRGAGLTAVATAVFCAVVILIGPWRADAVGWAFGVISPFAAQIAVTCAGLSLLRAFRHRGERGLGAGKLRWIIRGDAIALGSLMLSAVTGLAGAVLAAHPSQHSVVLVGSLVAIIVALPALFTLVRGQARTRDLGGSAEHPVPEGDDALVDVLRGGRATAVGDGAERPGAAGHPAGADLPHTRRPWADELVASAAPSLARRHGASAAGRGRDRRWPWCLRRRFPRPLRTPPGCRGVRDPPGH